MDINEIKDSTELENKEEVEQAVEEVPKKKKKHHKKSAISTIINVILWIILIAWMALVITDFVRVRKEEKPKFCWFNEKITDYEDGSVKECTGLGYKVINYDRASFKAIEFGPFWIKDRTSHDK